MASVLFTWSDMWLKWYNLQDANVKENFLNQINLRQTISQSPAKMQIEILECAPIEVKRMVNDVLRRDAKKKLFEEDNDGQVDELRLHCERIVKEHEQKRQSMRQGVATV